MRSSRRRFIQSSAGALACVSLPSWAQTTGAEIVLRGGTVLPVDASFSEHAALAIRGNRILAVGSEDSVMRSVGAGARVIDLEGRTVLPGFIEPQVSETWMDGKRVYASSAS